MIRKTRVGPMPVTLPSVSYGEHAPSMMVACLSGLPFSPNSEVRLIPQLNAKEIGARTPEVLIICATTMNNVEYLGQSRPLPLWKAVGLFLVFDSCQKQ